MPGKYADKEQKAKAVFDKIVGDMAQNAKYKDKIARVIYRDDYQDYRLILDDKTHCEIREKLFDAVVRMAGAGPKPDKQIVFGLRGGQ